MNELDQLCAEVNEKCKHLYALYELERELGLTWEQYCKWHEQADQSKYGASAATAECKHSGAMPT